MEGFSRTNDDMQSVVVTTSQLRKEDIALVAALVELHGGTYSSSLSPLVTHLVCVSPSGETYEQAKDMGIIVVSAEWVNACLDTQCRTPEDRYFFTTELESMGIDFNVDMEKYTEKLDCVPNISDTATQIYNVALRQSVSYISDTVAKKIAIYNFDDGGQSTTSRVPKKANKKKPHPSKEHQTTSDKYENKENNANSTYDTKPQLITNKKKTRKLLTELPNSNAINETYTTNATIDNIDSAYIPNNITMKESKPLTDTRVTANPGNCAISIDEANRGEKSEQNKENTNENDKTNESEEREKEKGLEKETEKEKEEKKEAAPNSTIGDAKDTSNIRIDNVDIVNNVNYVNTSYAPNEETTSVTLPNLSSANKRPATVLCASADMLMQDLVIVIGSCYFTLLRETIKAKLESTGATVHTQFSKQTTHFLTQYIPTHSIPTGVKLVSSDWLHDCLVCKRVLSPSKILHFPIPRNRFPNLVNSRICVSGFVGNSRSDLQGMIVVCGAKYTPELTRKNTHLICKYPLGAKYEKAKEWNIKIINEHWIQDVVKNWQYIDPDFYTDFAPEPKKMFSLSGCKGKQKAEWEKIITDLGGTVLGHDHKYDIHCTHLITATLKPTEKVLCACAAGIWILRAEFLYF